MAVHHLLFRLENVRETVILHVTVKLVWCAFSATEQHPSQDAVDPLRFQVWTFAWTQALPFYLRICFLFR
jgi:hypothetical protein